jgi:hypothetical protein
MTRILRARARRPLLAILGLLASATLATAAVLATSATTADAAPGDAKVDGKVDLPPGGVKEPPVEHVGWIDRVPNAITELRPYDPRPECFVYLEGGPAGPDASTPPPKPISWMLYASNFQIPILPVVTGTTVEIKNISQVTHPLYAPGNDSLLTAEPIGPGGIRPIKPAEVGKAVVIRSKDSPHLEARVVALPTRYFSRLKKDGSFTIDEVPPGKWTAKVWCKDGWLAANKAFDVGNRGGRVELTLPDRLEPLGAKPAGKQE